ncbi:MAG: CDP-alcohol phosphatidyltransferase family protein [Anaerolineaceae bacterium]|nr:CDP-alcohol phosphatidyltransferase family protein [Anaerolineaceae bacterium]MCB9099336.1 CDP-alcohol phosphatidyltransferase family protein [Anaerolineales bacterium]
MLDHYLRGAKDYVLAFLAPPLYRVHPITLSFIGLGFGLIAGIFLMRQQYLLGFIFWLINRILDGLDGAIARQTGRQSDLGGYIDIIFDFVIYAFIPIALVVGLPSTEAFLSLSFLLGSFYVNSASWMYLAAILEKRREGAKTKGELTTITMPSGLIGGAETVLFFSLFIIWPQQLILLFVLMGILVFFTTGQRLVWAARYLK